MPAAPATSATSDDAEALRHAAEVFTVASEAIDKLSWDSLTERLFVTYVSGQTYCYRDVPERVWEAFKAADSKGTFVNRSVKPHFVCAGPL